VHKPEEKRTPNTQQKAKMSGDEYSGSEDEVEEEVEEVTDLSNSDVCTKYQEAAKIVNLTLEGLVSQTVVGAEVLALCEFGTTVMETAASKLYTKKVNGETIDRGVAFPVCVSVNDVVCNFSPLKVKNDSEPEAMVRIICMSSSLLSLLVVVVALRLIE